MTKHSKKNRYNKNGLLKNSKNALSNLTSPITGNAEKTFDFVVNKSSLITEPATGLLNGTVGNVMNTIVKTGKRRKGGKHGSRRHKTRRHRR
jgi:hypothetical protein